MIFILMLVGGMLLSPFVTLRYDGTAICFSPEILSEPSTPRMRRGRHDDTIVRLHMMKRRICLRDAIIESSKPPWKHDARVILSSPAKGSFQGRRKEFPRDVSKGDEEKLKTTLFF